MVDVSGGSGDLAAVLAAAEDAYGRQRTTTSRAQTQPSQVDESTKPGQVQSAVSDWLMPPAQTSGDFRQLDMSPAACPSSVDSSSRQRQPPPGLPKLVEQSVDTSGGGAARKSSPPQSPGETLRTNKLQQTLKALNADLSSKELQAFKLLFNRYTHQDDLGMSVGSQLIETHKSGVSESNSQRVDLEAIAILARGLGIEASDDALFKSLRRYSRHSDITIPMSPAYLGSPRCPTAPGEWNTNLGRTVGGESARNSGEYPLQRTGTGMTGMTGMTFDMTMMSSPRETRTQTLDFADFMLWIHDTKRGAPALDPNAAKKARVRAAGKKPLNNKQIAHIKKIFDQFDLDGSGSIDAQEMQHVFKVFGEDVTEEEAMQLMADLDDSGDNEIQFDEFIWLMMNNFGEVSQESEMEQLLAACDADKTGLISSEGLTKLIEELCGDHIPPEEVREIVTSAASAASPWGRGNPTPDGVIQYMRWESLWDAAKE